MELLIWIIVFCCFIISFVGLIYPIIPSVLFIIAGFLIYGFLISFEQFSTLFWMIQGTFVLLLFGADYAANLIGVKKLGGSQAAVWGSTVGLLVGPFVIPVAGIILGPFLGAVVAELVVHKKNVKEATKIGLGSLFGFLSGVVAKGFIQFIMIIYFLFTAL
ncbi:DUF456 domain-containing protein [Cytobacillus sp. Hm23]